MIRRTTMKEGHVYNAHGFDHYKVKQVPKGAFDYSVYFKRIGIDRTAGHTKSKSRNKVSNNI
jgi:hypothetical protein